MTSTPTSASFYPNKIAPYSKVRWIGDSRGYIVWRKGTGDNYELLHIRTLSKGKGFGRSLFYDMLDRMVLDPPYYSVFGFTRTTNQEAQMFYGALGFNLQPVQGLYRDGTAIMFWQSFEELFALAKRGPKRI